MGRKGETNHLENDVVGFKVPFFPLQFESLLHGMRHDIHITYIYIYTIYKIVLDVIINILARERVY